MSRSNPTDNSPNPASKWIEWDGANGTLRYYDKTKKENVDMGDDFTFILLDNLACVKGWHEKSESGIFSNEVHDTRAETLVVKAFNGGLIAEGLYAQIRDRITAAGGHFTTNLYIAIKDGSKLVLASLQLKGAALNSWVDFQKANRSEIYDKAVRLKGSTEGKKGKVVFKVPNFSVVPLSGETNAQATALDKEVLQPYLKSYFKRTRTEQVAQPAPASEEEATQETAEREAYDASRRTPPPNDDAAEDLDIPF